MIKFHGLNRFVLIRLLFFFQRSYKLKYSDFFDPPESDGRDDDTFNRNQTVDVE